MGILVSINSTSYKRSDKVINVLKDELEPFPLIPLLIKEAILLKKTTIWGFMRFH